MTVDIATKDQLPLLFDGLDQLFSEVDGRMRLFGRLNPLSVEICA